MFLRLFTTTKRVPIKFITNNNQTLSAQAHRLSCFTSPPIRVAKADFHTSSVSHNDASRDQDRYYVCNQRPYDRPLRNCENEQKDDFLREREELRTRPFPIAKEVKQEKIEILDKEERKQQEEVTPLNSFVYP